MPEVHVTTAAPLDDQFREIEVCWRHNGTDQDRWLVELNIDAPVNELLPELIAELKIQTAPATASIRNEGTTRNPIYVIVTANAAV